MPMLWLRGCAVIADIELQELSGFVLKLYKPVSISLSQDEEGFFFRVEVVQVQCCDFSGPSPRVIKEMEDGIITKALFSFKIDGLKELQNLFRIQETDDGFLEALLWHVEDRIGQFSMLRVHQTDHFGKGFDSGESTIASLGQVFPLLLESIEERDNQG